MTQPPKILVVGWFSFDSPDNTAGDLLAKETAVKWIEEAGYDYDVAVPYPQLRDEIPTRSINQAQYIAVVYVCGPLISTPISAFMQQFKKMKRITLNVSIVESSDLSDDFDVIIARDGRGLPTNPDISLLTITPKTPVVGLMYVGYQREYPTQQHYAVEHLVSEVVAEMDLAVVPIDTRLPHNKHGLTSISQIESVISAMDIVITTRLHGSILALRNGIPAVAIDSVPGGAKVLAQMQGIGWPLAYCIDQLNKKVLKDAINKALLGESKKLAIKVTMQAVGNMKSIEQDFKESLPTL